MALALPAQVLTEVGLVAGLLHRHREMDTLVVFQAQLEAVAQAVEELEAQAQINKTELVVAHGVQRLEPLVGQVLREQLLVQPQDYLWQLNRCCTRYHYTEVVEVFQTWVLAVAVAVVAQLAASVDI